MINKQQQVRNKVASIYKNNKVKIFEEDQSLIVEYLVS